LCTNCYKEYSDRRGRREADTEGLEIVSLAGEHRERLSRSHEPVRPWVASLYMGLLGLLAIGLLLFVPSLRRVEWSEGQSFPTVYIAIVLPFLAVAWSFLGLFTRWSRASKWLNLIGLGFALATIGLAFFAVRPESSDIDLKTAKGAPSESEMQRSNLSRKELHDWRSKMLNRYEDENAPSAPKKPPIKLEELVPPPPSRQ
jgi:hypothetical protein